jgi:hypothetical protein
MSWIDLFLVGAYTRASGLKWFLCEAVDLPIGMWSWSGVSTGDCAQKELEDRFGRIDADRGCCV